MCMVRDVFSHTSFQKNGSEHVQYLLFCLDNLYDMIILQS